MIHLQVMQVTIRLTAGAGNDTISGGVGNDTIAMAGNLTSADTVTGGDGTDTVSVSAAVTVANAANVSGIETLHLTGAAGAVTQDMDAFDVASVRLSNNGNQVITLNDVAATTTSLVIEDATTGAQTAVLKADTSSDAMTLTLGTATAAAGTLTAVTMSDIEDMTISSLGGANTIT